MRIINPEGPPWQVRMTAHLYRGEEWIAGPLGEWVRWALGRLPSAGATIYRVEVWGPAGPRGDGMDDHFPCAMVIIDAAVMKPSSARRVEAALLRGLRRAETILSWRPPPKAGRRPSKETT